MLHAHAVNKEPYGMHDESFVALVAPHTAIIVRTAALLVGPADAEDAAQEAFVRAWQAWPELRESNAVRAWLVRITINVCHNWLSGHFGTNRLRTAPLDRATLLSLPLSSSPGDSDHTGKLDLQEALNSLTDNLRLIVQLRYFIGLDSTEIGQALHIPPATVRTRLRQALAVMREQLQPSSDLPAPATSERDQ
jgi:RNA polymerase sigma-70 factor, ECF subfamily